MTLVAERTRTWLDSAAVTRTIKVIAVVSLLLSLFVGGRQYQLASCLAAYSDASNASTRARSLVAEQDRAALDKMIDAVANARGLPPAEAKRAVDQAFSDYRSSRAFGDGARSVSPIPEPPSAKC